MTWAATAFATTAVVGLGTTAIQANKNTSTTTSQGAQDGTTTGSGTQTTTTLSPEVVQQLRELIYSNQFDKTAALTDARKAGIAASQKVLQTNLPVIGANEKSAGLAGSTMTQQLGINTLAEASAAGAATQIGSVNNYSSMLSNLINSFTAGTPKTTSGEQGTITHQDATAAPPSQSNNSMCFITTAVCTTLGKPDDCEELTLLRSFRDGYMHSTAEFDMLVQQYYAEAPGIVAKLDKLTVEKKTALYSAFNKVYIAPAVMYIKQGKYAKALDTYKALFELAKTKAGEI